MTPFSRDQLIQDEGIVPIPYQDSLGVWTVGCGHNMNKPFSHAVIMHIFDEDVAEAENNLVHAFPWYSELDEARQGVMVNLCFNMGLTRLQGFKKFLAHMALEEWDAGAVELLDSTYARQVKERAVRLAAIIRG